jgi:hypothetical protein
MILPSVQITIRENLTMKTTLLIISLAVGLILLGTGVIAVLVAGI